jgi:indolepyruvate ferredoxin oxidoreductase beta subunit
MTPDRPVTLLIAALGGEGGGVLTDWIVQAAIACDLPVQATSVPGVAQRTGATTYYVEIFPQTRAQLAGKQPLFALLPGMGEVDVMLASELLEAGRAAANGFITPDRTLLIASTHRVYSVAEKTALGDGRFDMNALLQTVEQRSAEHVLFDMQSLANASGAPISAVMLGALAGSGRLPIPADAFIAAIKAEGKSVAANLAGFELGRAAITQPAATVSRATEPTRQSVSQQLAAFDGPARSVIEIGVGRLVDYQSAAYAQLYLDRLAPIRDAETRIGGDGTLLRPGCDGSLLRDVARHLAVRMAFDDVIRVAQLKIDPARGQAVRREVRAKDGQPVLVIDYFKPGIEEICSLLPPRLAEPILRFSAKRGWLGRVYVGMHIKSNSIFGFLRLKLLSKLRWMRPRSLRWRDEQALTERWLAAIVRAIPLNMTLAREIADCARLIKGYGETHKRGWGNFDRVFAALVGPALSGALPPSMAADAIASARVAALSDDSGKRLDEVLAAVAALPALSKAAE